MNNKVGLIANFWKTTFPYIVIGLFVFNSCEKKGRKFMEKVVNYSTADTLPEYSALSNVDSLNEKLNKIKRTGDTNAYDELSVAYFMSGELHSFYYYSLITANKYQYSKAYLDLYLALSEPYTGEGFDDLDKRTQRLAIYYLLKAYELGDITAINLIEERFGKGKIPKSSSYQYIQ